MPRGRRLHGRVGWQRFMLRRPFSLSRRLASACHDRMESSEFGLAGTSRSSSRLMKCRPSQLETGDFSVHARTEIFLLP